MPNHIIEQVSFCSYSETYRFNKSSVSYVHSTTTIPSCSYFGAEDGWQHWYSFGSTQWWLCSVSGKNHCII